MDFYEKKTKAKNDITKLYYEGNSTIQIINYIGLTFGFGKKLVEEQIELLEQIEIENSINNKKEA